MPCLSNRFDPKVGAILNVSVLPPKSIIPGQPVQISSVVPALIDTGATFTCIAPAVAQNIGINPIGKRPMTSANQTQPTNIYLVDLVLPIGSAGFYLVGMQVFEFMPQPQSPYQILLGRDVICRGAFTMSFDGHYSFSI